MKVPYVCIPLCLALTVGCGGSHPDSTTTSGSGSQGTSGNMSGSSMSAASPMASMSGMSGNSMSGSTNGSVSGHHHHKHSETAMNGTDSTADGSASGAMTGGAMSSSGAPMQFTTEAAATSHCPSDTVVWLNLKSKVYHLKGSERYGKTKHGAYVCETEANSAGDRAAK